MNGPPPRLIAHLDMDAFYASVELLRYPDLRGQPVVIGGGRAHAPVMQSDGTRRYFRLREYTGRGVITTATYEARALGVHSAMGVMKAAQLAPDAVLLPVDFDEYRKYSRLFKAAVRTVAPLIEDRGIDIDLTEVPGAQADAGLAVGRALKSAVREATGLGCSIGITPNKLLSKICSDLDKPDGLTLLALADIPARIWPLPARKINGIGPKATEKLARLGIHTIGELAAADPAWLVVQFGKSYGARWSRTASPSPSAARPPSSATCTRCATAPRWGPSSPSSAWSWPATSRARAMRARPSASSCASTTSRSSRATSRSPPTRWTPAPSAVPPASA
jgi:DNA polymerase-4